MKKVFTFIALIAFVVFTSAAIGGTTSGLFRTISGDTLKTMKSGQDRKPATGKTSVSGKGSTKTSTPTKNAQDPPPGTITYPKPMTAKEKELALKNDEAARLYGEGVKALQKNDNKKAIEYFTQSIEQYKVPVTLLRRSLCYIIEKKYNEALADVNEVIKEDTSIAYAYFARGLIFYQMNMMPNAELDLTHFVERDSTNIQAYNYLAAIKFMKKDYSAALTNYNRVIYLNPKFPDAYVNRGMMRHNMGDLEGAISDYNEELKAKPTNAKAYNNRGAAYMTLQRNADALTDFTQAIKLKEDYGEAYENRGKIELRISEKDAACADFKKGLELGMTSCEDMIKKFCNQ